MRFIGGWNRMLTGRTALLAAGVTATMIVGLSAPRIDAGSFNFADETRGVDVITHPHHYSGVNANLNVTVGIDPGSAHASEMVTSVQNTVNTINAFVATTGNVSFSPSNNVPAGTIDFESTLLHEMGHALGLGHPNLGTLTSSTNNNDEATKTTDGANDGYDFNHGSDGIAGSSDDQRGDDANLNWFPKASNNPGAPLPATIDSTTFSRNIADLPMGHTFAANGGRNIYNQLGFANTESVMQQGTFTNEAQRTFSLEDVATFRIGMAGYDEIQGTADDYTFSLSYVGMTGNADIVVAFDSTQTGFATTFFSAFIHGPTGHRVITDADVYFNDGFNWFFNDQSNGTDPDNLYVDFNAPSNGVGTPGSPFDNLADAVSTANNNATINLEPGSSPETFTGGGAISKPLTLRNDNPGGGSVFVGS